MTRKDYVKAAEICAEVSKGLPPSVGPAALEKMVQHFGDWFSSDNPRFDYNKFWHYAWKCYGN